MVKARQWQLSHRPRDDPQLSGPEQTWKLVEVDLPEPKDDELLVKLLAFSNDPAQRGWIDPDIPPERLYVPPVQVGAPMASWGLAEVVESKSSRFKVGDTVTTSSGWSDHAVVDAGTVQPARDLPGGRSKTHYLGVLGMTGLTAYCGLRLVGEATKDDIVVVSGAAGATGSTVVQIAKKIIGCKKVIGIAGTDEKCRWVERLGADVCLNYKAQSFVKDMEKATHSPEGFADVYFDNVGGTILDLVITRMARNGRIVACGAISSYNTSSERTTGLKNWFDIVAMRLKVQGFIVSDFGDKFAEILHELREGVAEGKLDIDDGETVIKATFEDVPKTWLKLFDGSNQGKLVTLLEG